ncbi:glucose-6-phosphate dehydrogenase assembly protein OpcA [candidate division KSB1 bacterium]|nr:glucose-6-phosphate dehydrogenase assembly protein OpcA [candidate division KSB1 bacterium]
MEKIVTKINTTYADGIPVELPDIENRLRSFWLNIARDSGKTVMRASTMNLIVIHSEREKYDNYQKILIDLSGHHPGRIVHVFIDYGSQSDKVFAAVSALCKMPGSDDRQICCEQVVIKTGSSGEKHISGAVIPLMLPALPVYVVLTDPRFMRSKALNSLYEITDKVIFDFFFKNNLQSAFKNMVKLSHGTAVGDIVWSYLSAWRDAIVPLFDGAAGKKYRDGIRKLKISCTDPNECYWVYLMAGWIISRFGWRFNADQNNFTLKREKNSSIELSVAREKPAAIKFETYENISLSSVLEDDRFISLIRQGNSILFEQPKSIHRPDVSLLLCDELDDTSTLPVYRESLIAASKIYEVIGEIY